MNKKVNVSHADIIYAYTRTDAIRDGALIDVSATAKEAGIIWPVALTSTVHAKHVQVPPAADCQDETGRLWDILMVLQFAIRQCATQKDGLLFSLFVNNGDGARKVMLKSVRAYDDEDRPCLTIMLPEED